MSFIIGVGRRDCDIVFTYCIESFGRWRRPEFRGYCQRSLEALGAWRGPTEDQLDLHIDRNRMWTHLASCGNLLSTPLNDLTFLSSSTGTALSPSIYFASLPCFRVFSFSCTTAPSLRRSRYQRGLGAGADFPVRGSVIGASYSEVGNVIRSKCRATADGSSDAD